FGIVAVIAGLWIAFGAAGSGHAAPGPSWDPNDPDPPFGLFPTPPGGAKQAAANANASDRAPIDPGGPKSAGPQTASGPSIAAVTSDSSVSVGVQPSGVAATDTRAYVANSQSNSVSVLDLTTTPASVIATI